MNRGVFNLCGLVQHITCPYRPPITSFHVSFENLELDQGNIEECLCAQHLPIGVVNEIFHE